MVLIPMALLQEAKVNESEGARVCGVETGSEYPAHSFNLGPACSNKQRMGGLTRMKPTCNLIGRDTGHFDSIYCVVGATLSHPRACGPQSPSKKQGGWGGGDSRLRSSPALNL